MKTYSGLYPQIYDFDNIHLAYLKARRSKRYKQEILRFSANLEENLIDIQNRLIWKMYRPSRYKYFTIYEPKQRLIAALPFMDRVVHHALCNLIEPIFEKSMIHDSYACRRGQGVLAGVLRTNRFIRDAGSRWGRVYCLKADITKFFPSIDHEILKRILRRRIACPDTLVLIDTIIDSTETDQGIPIGSLTSQLWANVYLNELDHFIKETLLIRYYIRYMDDFIIFHHDKHRLRVILEEIIGFLDGALRLTLNSKTQIFPIQPRCVDFLGYRIWPGHRLLRKANVRRVRRKFQKQARLYSQGLRSLETIRPGIASWLGHAKHADTWRLRRRIFDELVFIKANQNGLNDNVAKGEN